MSILMQDHAIVERAITLDAFHAHRNSRCQLCLNCLGSGLQDQQRWNGYCRYAVVVSHAAGWRIVIVGDNDRNCTCLLGIVDLGFEVA